MTVRGTPGQQEAKKNSAVNISEMTLLFEFCGGGTLQLDGGEVWDYSAGTAGCASALDALRPPFLCLLR